MKPEQTEILWKELFEILKTIADQKEHDAEKLEKVLQLIESSEEKLTAMKITALPTDLSPVKQTIEAGFEKIKIILSAQPKNIAREFHFHLFPKINIKEYYQTYSKLILFIIIFGLILALINFGDKWIEGYNKRQEDLHQFQLNEKSKSMPTEDDRHTSKQKGTRKN